MVIRVIYTELEVGLPNQNLCRVDTANVYKHNGSCYISKQCPKDVHVSSTCP